MAKTANTKFIARWNGEIVGTRKSPRPYTHAVIAEHVEEFSRAKAYAACPYDDMNYDYDLFVATGTPGQKYPKAGYSFTHKFTAERVAASQALVEGGKKAYTERHHQKRIAAFEKSRAEGYYGKPFVLGWSMSAHNASKMAAACKGGYSRVLGIVPAEVA